MNIDDALVVALQKKLNHIFQIVFEMPLYRHLDLDRNLATNLMTKMFQDEPDTLAQLVEPNAVEAYLFSGFIGKFIAIYDEALSFRTYIALMLDRCFESLPKRNSECYAHGVYSFFKDAHMWTELSRMLDFPDFLLFQSQKTYVEYTTMPNPANEKEYIIAERMTFDSLGAFLHVDFFRGLMHGNAPRRCHNCKQFFLLSGGYDARYCNNIAPGETERSCRKVGAHRKETQKAGIFPIEAEYKRVYNRLKTRHSRGKIDVKEWNDQVALIQVYKDQAQKGQISEFEMTRLCDEI